MENDWTDEVAAITRRLELIELAVCTLAATSKTVGPLSKQIRDLHAQLQMEEPLMPGFGDASLVHLLDGLAQAGVGV
jgi:hypothetical protein